MVFVQQNWFESKPSIHSRLHHPFLFWLSHEQPTKQIAGSFVHWKTKGNAQCYGSPCTNEFHRRAKRGGLERIRDKSRKSVISRAISTQSRAMFAGIFRLPKKMFRPVLWTRCDEVMEQVTINWQGSNSMSRIHEYNLNFNLPMQLLLILNLTVKVRLRLNSWILDIELQIRIYTESNNIIQEVKYCKSVNAHKCKCARRFKRHACFTVFTFATSSK